MCSSHCTCTAMLEGGPSWRVLQAQVLADRTVRIGIACCSSWTHTFQGFQGNAVAAVMSKGAANGQAKRDAAQDGEPCTPPHTLIAAVHQVRVDTCLRSVPPNNDALGCTNDQPSNAGGSQQGRGCRCEQAHQPTHHLLHPAATAPHASSCTALRVATT